MISSVLSRIFLWVLVIVTIGASGNLIAHIINKPLEIKLNKNSSILLGQPGMSVKARISNLSTEKLAPDTTITFFIKDSLGFQLFSGSYSYGRNEIKKWDYEIENEARVKSYIKEAKKNSQQYQLDTQITLIGSQNISIGNLGIGSESSFSKLEDGRVEYTYQEENYENGQTGKTIKDTFYNEAAANRFDVTQHWKKNGNDISQMGTVIETLRIMPRNTWQHLLFVMYHFIFFGGFAFLLLWLHQIFKRFSHKKFFEIENVTAVKYIGWTLLIKGLAGSLFPIYMAFNIFPQKATFKYGTSGNSQSTQHYQLDTTIDWQTIFLGLGLIVLSHIFKQALQLKQEQDLTV